MRKKQYGQTSLLDQLFIQKKQQKTTLDRINQVIDWKSIEQLLDRYYTKGKKKQGRIANCPLVLFKMMLLQIWYNLSDEKIENILNDRISFMKFCGLQINDPAPDHTSLARFRQMLAQQNSLEILLSVINKQLIQKKLLVKEGVIVDASITDSPHKYNSKDNKELTANNNQIAKIRSVSQ